MSFYLIFFGKSSEFTSFAFDSNQFLPDFERNVFKDFDQLESRFLVNDQLANALVLSKYNFSYMKKGFSMLKMYGCAMANNANRISGSSYGVAIISDHDILVTDYNTDLLLKTTLKFKQLAIENNRFSKTNFFEFAQMLWGVFVKEDFFSQIQTHGDPYVSSNSTPIPILSNDFLGLDKIVKEKIRISSKIYFSSDLGHIQRSISNYGSRIPIFEISNGKLIEYREEVIQEIVQPEIKSENDIVSEQSSEESVVIETNANHEIELENRTQELKALESALLNERELVISMRNGRFLTIIISLGLLLSLIASFFFFQKKISELETNNNILKSKVNKIEKKNNVEENYKVIVPTSYEFNIESINKVKLIEVSNLNLKIIKDLNMKVFTDTLGKVIPNIYLLKSNNNIHYYRVDKNKFIKEITANEIKNLK